MKHMAALALKFIVAAAVMEILLGMYSNLDSRQILLLCFAFTAVAYLIGDLVILYVFNNTIAAVADAGLCWLIVYLGNYIWPDANIPLISALSAAVIIGIGEIVLHPAIEKNILHRIPGDPDPGSTD